MKSIIDRIFSIKALVALMLVCIASSAWAALVAEWNGDFGVATKNGYNLTIGSGNTFENGVITIGSSSTTPVLITHSTGGEAATLVIGIKTSSSDTVGTVAHCAYGDAGKGVYAYLNVDGESTSRIQYGWKDSSYDDYWSSNGGNVTWSSDAIQYVTLVALTDTDAPHNSNAEPRGETVYLNGTVVGSRVDGLRASNTAMKYFGVGGNVGRNSSDGMLNGAEITYIAIYDEALYSATTPTVAQAAVPTNLNLMYLISGDTIGASDGVALANDAGYGNIVPTVWQSGYRNYDGTTRKYGNSMRMNGGTIGLVDNTNGLGVNTTEGFTISFWADLVDGLADWKSFLGIRVGESNLRLERQDSNNIAMYYFNATTAPSGGTKFSDMSYTASSWSHYALVFAPNNGGLTVYKDGTLVKTVTADADIQGTLYQVGMGMGRNGSAADSNLRGTAPANVYIDDLAIFKGALSATQISAIASSETAISGPVYGMFRNVSFNTPNESVWASANLPTYARTLTYGSGTVSFANDTYSKTTINNKAARLTNITGGSYAEIDGYIKKSEVADTTSDVYLRVSDATTATRISGMGEAHWTGSGTRTLTGNVLVNLTGSVVADLVMGAGYKGGSTTLLTGNVGVVIDGNAIVKGTVLGGWSSVHNYKPKIDGSTYVLVKNVQGTNGATAEGSIPNGYIMGGSAYQGNYGRSWITGSTSVAVVLPNDATGTFVKGIVGGSYGNESAADKTTQIDGSSSVTITAPNAVTFSGNIIGGSWADSGTASVGVNTAVTLNGGTYTGTIYAGGYGNGTPTVAGNATLTLNGGVYSSATLLPGTASGTKAIVISGDTDLSGATIGAFDEFTVDATKTLTLGTKRLVGDGDPTLASTSAGVVALTLTEEEYTAKYAQLLKCAASDVSGQYVIYYNDTDITSEIASKVSVLSGYLTYLDSSSYESSIAAEITTNWDDVIWSMSDSSTDTMANVAANPTAEATLTLNGTLVIDKPVTFTGELLEITGSGTIVFTGSATLSGDVSVNIGSGITLDFSGLTNLTNMGLDTIISAGNDVSIGTSSVSYPAGWACHTITSSDSMKICGACFSSDVISVNIIGGTLYEGTTWYTGCSIADSNTAGYLPIQGTKWNQTVHASAPTSSSVDVQTSALKEVLSDNSVVTSAGVTMTVKASGPYADFWSGTSRDNNDGNSQLMYGYLDDGETSDGKGAKIVVNNIPYSEYAVLVYMGTDQSSGSFGCVYVNGIGYYGANGLTVEGTSAWGSYASTHGSITLGEGSNYLRIAGLTGSSVTIQGSKNANGNRCGISGVQIVNTGLRGATYSATLEGSDATLLPSGTSTGMTKTSSETWVNNGEGKIYLTNPSDATSTVTIGENVSVKVFKIMGAGKVTLAIGAGSALSISGGKIDLSEFSGTLCVDSTVAQTFFAGVSTNGGEVRFLASGLSFSSDANLPNGRMSFVSATLSAQGTAAQTIVVRDGDIVTLADGKDRYKFNFDICGGELKRTATGQLWIGGDGAQFNMSSGTVNIGTSSETTSDSSSGCVLFGWSGSCAATISGGTFNAESASVNLWENGSHLRLSGTAVFKAKSIWSNNANNAVSIVGDAKLVLTGTKGISSNIASLTMNGGTIEFQETATISEPLTLTSGVESTINIADTKSATISTVALSAVPAVGDKILATNGGTITVSAITAGGEAQVLDLSYWSDGVYVAAAEYDSVNYPSVSAAIAVATDDHLADITLLNGCTTVPDGYYIADGTVCKHQAAIINNVGGVVSYHVSAQAAVDASLINWQNYDHVEVYYGTDVEVRLGSTWQVVSAGYLKIKCLNGATVDVDATDAEFTVSASEPVDGLVSYTYTKRPMTYTWGGSDGALTWARPQNWRHSDSQVATRAVEAIDSAVLNNGAAIIVTASTSVKGIVVNGAVTLAKTTSDVTLVATTDGIVLADGATLAVTGVTLSPAPVSGVALKYVRATTSEGTTTYSLQAAGEMDGTTAKITDATAEVTVPETANAIEADPAVSTIKLADGSTIAANNVTVKYNGTTITGAFNISVANNQVTIALNPSGTVEGVSVRPACNESVTVDEQTLAPMSLNNAGNPMFAFKTIPGLWYVVETSTDGSNYTAGTAVQATGGTKAISAELPGEDETVLYYRVGVGATKASAEAQQ